MNIFVVKNDILLVLSSLISEVCEPRSQPDRKYLGNSQAQCREEGQGNGVLRCVTSMPDRIWVCIDAEGEHTKY
ncbi:1702_t:CDS:2 [Entrophospora sp. SA101]|nr:1702_t:CDS:2 [Entrophospora sp. SA101]